MQTYLNGTDNLANAIIELDTNCKDNAEVVGAEIITSDGITYYQAGPNRTFGSTVGSSGESAAIRNFGPDGNYKDEVGAENAYG